MEVCEGVARVMEESFLEGFLEDARGNGGNFGEIDDCGVCVCVGVLIDGFDCEFVV